MVRLRSLIRSNKGFTLLELIIAMSIMGIISLMVTSILRFALMGTETGTDLRDEHAAVRLVSTIITNELRTAFEVQIVADEINDNIDRTIYYNANNFYRYDGGTSMPISKGLISSVVFTIEVDGDRAYVDYQITGIDGFQVNSRLYLVNADASTLTEASGSIITYDYVTNGRR